MSSESCKSLLYTSSQHFRTPGSWHYALRMVATMQTCSEIDKKGSTWDEAHGFFLDYEKEYPG